MDEGRGREDRQTKRLHMFSPSLPRTGLGALPHSRVNRFFFFLICHYCSPAQQSLVVMATATGPTNLSLATRTTTHAAVSHTYPSLYVCIPQAINSQKNPLINQQVKREKRMKRQNCLHKNMPLVDSQGNGCTGLRVIRGKKFSTTLLSAFVMAVYLHASLVIFASTVSSSFFFLCGTMCTCCVWTWWLVFFPTLL